MFRNDKASVEILDWNPCPLTFSVHMSTVIHMVLSCSIEKQHVHIHFCHFNFKVVTAPRNAGSILIGLFGL